MPSLTEAMRAVPLLLHLHLLPLVVGDLLDFLSPGADSDDAPLLGEQVAAPAPAPALGGSELYLHLPLP